MRWFQGAIPAAIASAKRSGAVFVVFVAGDDEQSTQMAASWEDEKVTEASSNSFVAIKIDTKSEACLQFSQIYPVVCVPSSFFIGDSGIPLEVIAGSISADELVNRIHKVQQMHSVKGETSMANDNPIENSVSTPPTSFEPTSTSENSQYRNVELCEAPPTSDSKSESATESPGHATSSQEASGCSNQRPAEDLTIRVERLTKKLEERREEKRKEEEQKEIKKEIERRKTGKEMLDYKRKQEEELTKRMLEERNREKAEDRAARERIKQQIALDRAERAARFAKTKEEVEAAKAAALQAKQAEMEIKRDSAAKRRSTIARIQFRLPDGSSFTNQFPSDAPLEEARQFAAQTVGNTYGNFSLATMFPRREFTKEDYKKKLLDLELAPSASVVLLPAGRPTTSIVHSSSGDIWTLLGTVLYPFLAIWRLISNFLFSNPPPAQTSVRATSSEPSNLASSSNSEKREPVRKRVLEKRGEDFKKEGKIYRLRTQDDGEDENNTWNGNSTQQM
ncbi:PREDICTED: UBX domain-containing protein 4 isoform X2 [Condylura cristata]|uniref:UBX domain-containing protein 4 isoform X2 n=1 Tax=Condylura cristata TaxID=143302 RepID=UPI00064371B8|nr:PREDICTED: UBX domain-containing protein 4 isoform X2 [Condylura cristata]